MVWAVESKWKASSVLHVCDWNDEGILSESLQLARKSVTHLHTLDRASLSYNTGERNFPILSLLSVLAIVSRMLWTFTHFTSTSCCYNNSEKLVVALEDLEISHTFLGAAIDLAQFNISIKACKRHWTMQLKDVEG